MKIAIAGTGYVGLANGLLLAQHHDVYAYDIVQEKVDRLNSGISPVVDADIEEYLQKDTLSRDDKCGGGVLWCGIYYYCHADGL